MNSVSQTELEYWNTQGLIPGPEEDEETYVKRARFCLDLKQQLIQKVNAELPFSISDSATKEILFEAEAKTNSIYGMRPEWTPVFFNNYQLSPWHAGCAWIFQLNEETPTSAFLQLRAQFRNQISYLGIYNRTELIAHELAHVGRMAYQEPKFEEILAYQSSCSSWRRWLGPIIQTPKESLFFILLLGLIIITDLASFTLNTPTISKAIVLLKCAPFILLFYALARLYWRQNQFKRCLKKLELLFKNAQTARHLIYRLRDQEIKQFAASPLQTIDIFIREQPTHSFRWHFLTRIYPLIKPEEIKD